MRYCGNWLTPASSTGRALTSEHGEIKSCIGVGRVWLVFELGGPRPPGGIDEFRCLTPGCTPSSTTFQARQWTYVAPPVKGGVTLLGPAGHDRWIVDNAGDELRFDPRSETFSSDSR